MQQLWGGRISLVAVQIQGHPYPECLQVCSCRIALIAVHAAHSKHRLPLAATTFLRSRICNQDIRASYSPFLEHPNDNKRNPNTCKEQKLQASMRRLQTQLRSKGNRKHDLSAYHCIRCLFPAKLPHLFTATLHRPLCFTRCMKCRSDEQSPNL